MSENNSTELGALASWQGKTFIEKEIGAQYVGTSINSTEPGGESPFWHMHHKLEEIYIFIEGEGEMVLGDERVAVTAGSVVRAAEGVWHAMRALPTSPVALKWLCVRAGGDSLANIGNDAELDKEKPFPWAE